ncbi:MAG: ATP-binding cassette domain-containing protein, partial [Anaerovoracaceae bacterium]
MLTAEHIDYIYGKGQPDETYALQDVSLSVKRGEFIGIIGHTGSGKSTLIQHFNGLLKPDRGTIVVDGCDITAKNTVLRDVRRKVGLVFQYPEYQLFEETVEKDVAYGPKNIGFSEEEILRRVKEALQLVDLSYETFARRSPFDLSGGQKRRAAIAGVLAMQPEILILDEPTAGLDP